MDQKLIQSAQSTAQYHEIKKLIREIKAEKTANLSSTESSRKTVESDSCEERKKESMVEMICGKDRFTLRS